MGGLFQGYVDDFLAACQGEQSILAVDHGDRSKLSENFVMRKISSESKVYPQLIFTRDSWEHTIVRLDNALESNLTALFSKQVLKDFHLLIHHYY